MGGGGGWGGNATLATPHTPLNATLQPCRHNYRLVGDRLSLLLMGRSMPQLNSPSNCTKVYMSIITTDSLLS